MERQWNVHQKWSHSTGQRKQVQQPPSERGQSGTDTASQTVRSQFQIQCQGDLQWLQSGVWHFGQQTHIKCMQGQDRHEAGEEREGGWASISTHLQRLRVTAGSALGCQRWNPARIPLWCCWTEGSMDATVTHYRLLMYKVVSWNRMQDVSMLTSQLIYLQRTKGTSLMWHQNCYFLTLMLMIFDSMLLIAVVKETKCVYFLASTAHG